MLTLNIIPSIPLILPVEEIRMDQSPTRARWALIPLYKPSVDEGFIFWQIGFDGSQLEISQGCGENITTVKEELVSDGDVKESALRAARERYKLKYGEGYQPAGASSPQMVDAMKGYDYSQKSVKSWPVYTQAKVHGIHMLCQDLGRMKKYNPSDTTITNGLSMRSRLSTSYNHLNHIEEELRDFFPYLPKYCTLDGDLYSPVMDFSQLTAAVKTVKSVHPMLTRVQYWISDINYDDPDGAPYEKRCALLINAFRHYIQDRSPANSPDDVTVLPRTFVIMPIQIARTHEEIVQQYKQHIVSGYDGIMIKKISNGNKPGTKEYNECLYKPGKCNHILKYKE